MKSGFFESKTESVIEFGIFESALLLFKKKLERFNADFLEKNDYYLIETIKYRIKSNESIKNKLAKKKAEYTYESIVKNINDVAGMRIICPFVDDVYFVLSFINNIPDVEIIRIKDYIENPKENGYRSLHVQVKVPITFNEYTEYVCIEVQLRTIAMDFWASLEHQLVYKNTFTHGKGRVNSELYEYSQMINSIDRRMQVLKRSDHCGKNIGN